MEKPVYYTIGQNYIDIFLLAIFVPILCYLIYKTIIHAHDYLKKTLTVTIRVTGSGTKGDEVDYLYHWLLRWFAKNIPEAQSLSATHYIEGKVDYSSRMNRPMTFMTPPGYGIHYFVYQGAWIQVIRELSVNLSSEGCCPVKHHESFVLTTFWWNRSILFQILEECRQPEKKVGQKTVIYQNGAYRDGWRRSGQPTMTRELETVIMSEGLQEKIVQDIQLFLTREEWYAKRGIPYRRGYLLEGPAGNGKTSLVTAIAGAIGHDICVLSLAAEALCDDTLNDLMNNAPAEKCIMLLEDIDVAFKSRSDKTATKREQTLAFGGEGSSRVTFAGLLNAIDGVVASNGRILIMTTNYVERLDPALIRHGRIDVKVHLANPDDKQIRKIIKQLYVDHKMESEKMIKGFIGRLRELEESKGIQVSMAMIQSFLIQEIDEENLEVLLERMEAFFEEQCKEYPEESADDEKTECSSEEVKSESKGQELDETVCIKCNPCSCEEKVKLGGEEVKSIS